MDSIKRVGAFMPGGRPKKIIDYKIVEALSKVMATQEEIASQLDISARTLQKDEEFLRVYKKGLDSAKVSLRRKQYLLADTNATMGIWLGKQYLGQKDKQEIEHSGEQTLNLKSISIDDLRKMLND